MGHHKNILSTTAASQRPRLCLTSDHSGVTGRHSYTGQRVDKLYSTRLCSAELMMKVRSASTGRGMQIFLIMFFFLQINLMTLKTSTFDPVIFPPKTFLLSSALLFVSAPYTPLFINFFRTTNDS